MTIKISQIIFGLRAIKNKIFLLVPLMRKCKEVFLIMAVRIENIFFFFGMNGIFRCVKTRFSIHPVKRGPGERSTWVKFS